MTLRLINGEPAPWYPLKVLSHQQARALATIHQVVLQTGRPPTLRELSKELGLSVARAQELVNHLVAKGQLQRETGRSRAIRVVNGWIQSNDWLTKPKPRNTRKR
jgi:SOS-response transcriptional repressor LexA